eukprot:1869773-Amphidinium_carterae.1
MEALGKSEHSLGTKRGLMTRLLKGVEKKDLFLVGQRQPPFETSRECLAHNYVRVPKDDVATWLESTVL